MNVSTIRTHGGAVGRLAAAFFIDQPAVPSCAADGGGKILKAEVTLAQRYLFCFVPEGLQVASDESAGISAEKLGRITSALIGVPCIHKEADQFWVRAVRESLHLGIVVGELRHVVVVGQSYPMRLAYLSVAFEMRRLLRQRVGRKYACRREPCGTHDDIATAERSTSRADRVQTTISFIHGHVHPDKLEPRGLNLLVGLGWIRKLALHQMVVALESGISQ